VNYQSKAHMNSFAGAEAHYNSITPINSKVVGVGADLRPVGRRSNKHETIKKFSDNCYAICSAGVHSNTDYRGAPSPSIISDVDQLRGAPIVWRRTGTMESITIHNDTVSQSIAWYGILHACLPMGFSFDASNGAHAVTVYGTKFYLPLNRHLPAIPKEHLGYRGRPGTHMGTSPAHERSITFTRPITNPPQREAAWTLVGEPHNVNTVRACVDKEAKAVLMLEIKAFKSWLFSIMPLLADQRPRALETSANAEAHAYATSDEAPAELQTVSGALAHPIIPSTGWRQPTEPMLAASREAILRPDHPMRMAVATAIIAQSVEGEENYASYGEGVDTPEAVQRRHRARINKSVDRTLGLISKK